MRAVLKTNPPYGPGYAILEIYGAGDMSQPMLVLWRMSDGYSLADGGWRTGSNTLPIGQVENGDDCVRIGLAPNVVDDLSPSSNYELEVVGLGRCALSVDELFQSRIIDDNGADLTPPPPAMPLAPPLDPEPVAKIQESSIYEGVEKTPEDIPAGFDSRMPAGVSSGPDNAIPDSSRKRRGCALLGLLLFCAWAGGGWYLWHSALNAPTPQADETAAPFEIIPKSTENSFIEDDESQDGTAAATENVTR